MDRFAFPGAPVARGARVPDDYGSAAGELAACVRGVGLADRGELGALEVLAPEPLLAELGRRLGGVPLAPGGAAFAAGGWWCRDERGLLALCEPEQREHVAAHLLAALGELRGTRLRERSAELHPLALLGARAPELLTALGALASPEAIRAAPPFGRASLAGVETALLLQSDRRILVIADREHAPGLWSAIEEAGRPLSISLVGRDAARRFALLDRLPCER
jgi:glycine cleavage system aminomethyltransferase T